MRIAFLAVPVILFSSILSFAQNQSIDSLQGVIKENKSDTAVIKAHLSLAFQFEKSNPDSSEKIYLHALTLLQSAIDKTPASSKETGKALQKLLGDAYASLGALYANQVKILQSLDYDYKCLKIREQLNDKTGMAEALNNIAFIHDYYLEDYTHALETYLQALKYIKETGDKYGESTLLHNIADIYGRQGDTALALNYHLRSLKMREEIGDKQAISNALNSLSIIYREKKDLDRAFEYGEKSLQLRREIGDKRGIAYALRNLGEAYLAKGDIAKALELGQQALQAGKQLGNPDIVEKSASMLQKIYEKLGKWKDALEMNKLFVQMRDSTGNKKNGIIAIRQQVNYEYQKRAMADSLKFIVTQQEKDLQIEQQQTMLSKERILRNSIIAISVLSLLVGIIAFNNVRIKNKASRMAEANEVRRKISRDLHDEIGSGLTSITMICEQAKMKSKNKPDDTSMLALAERIRMQSKSVYEKLREVIWSTNPENDNLEVLFSYMRNYISNFFENSSIVYTINLPDEAPKMNLKPDVSRNLIFVFKEALNNIVKHSNATEVDVNFTLLENKRYTLLINDNGKGIDFDSMPAHHNGLEYMRRRIEELNGKFEVHSRAGNGTQIQISGIFPG
jgi:two-component system, NarL family, sensor histidine kinase UhpB